MKEDKFSIIIVGYRWYHETLERTLKSIILTNKNNFKIYLGVNSPSEDMMSMIDKYKNSIHHVEVSDTNLGLVGMQSILFHACNSKYVISFNDDTYPTTDMWQDLLLQRISALEDNTIRYFGEFRKDKEDFSKKATNNTVGLMGAIFYSFLEGDIKKIVESSEWYDPNRMPKIEDHNPDINRDDQIWFVAGSFFVALREPYIRMGYPGNKNKQAYEDQILSYFYQYQGYRLGDTGFNMGNIVPLAVKENTYTTLGGAIVLNDGEMEFDLQVVEDETVEHSLDVKISRRGYENVYLEGYND